MPPARAASAATTERNEPRPFSSPLAVPRDATTNVGFTIGAVMIGLGLFIALRLPLTGRSLTGKLWLDLAFAFFFVVRGALQIARFRKLQRLRSTSASVGTDDRGEKDPLDSGNVLP
jgi:hypothetical protein